MASKGLKLRVSLFVLLVGLVASVPAFAGSAVIGSVAGSMNATIGGQALLPNTTLFSGDSLQVTDGVAVLAIGKASRMVFGRETVASFLRDEKEITVLLSQGNVSMYHPDDTVSLRVKAGDVSVLPATGFKTLGQVAMLNDSVVITAKEGSLVVESNGQKVNVLKGRTIMVPARARAPQGTSGGPKTGAHGGQVLQGVQLAASGASVVTSSIALKDASDANSSANSATTAANSANTTAGQAVTAANNAATAASNAATAATAAQTQAVASGCALNKLANSLGYASPYQVPTGFVCK